MKPTRGPRAIDGASSPYEGFKVGAKSSLVSPRDFAHMSAPTLSLGFGIITSGDTAPQAN